MSGNAGGPPSDLRVADAIDRDRRGRAQDARRGRESGANVPAHGQTGEIVCEIDAGRRRDASALLLSFVHHRCDLADADVATVDVLEAAAAELVDDLASAQGFVTTIVLDPDAPGLDLRLGVARPRQATEDDFEAGVVAKASFDEITVASDGTVRLVRSFDRRSTA